MNYNKEYKKLLTIETKYYIIQTKVLQKEQKI